MNLQKIKFVNIFVNILLIIISISLCLFFVDFVLHFTKYRHLLKREVYPKNYFIADKILGYRIANNVATTTHYFSDGSYNIWSNDIGCFDRTADVSGDYIYLTGDSFTWGFSPFNDKWGTIVENLIGKRVIKCGVGGYGTKQEYLKTERDLTVLPKPKVIILGYLSGNDIEDDSNFPNYTVYNGYLVNNLSRHGTSTDKFEESYYNLYYFCSKNPKNKFVEGIKCWFNNHSIVFNLLKNNARSIVVRIFPHELVVKYGLVVEEKSQNLFQEDDQNLYQNFLNLLSFNTFSKENDIKFLVVLMPGDNKRQEAFLNLMNIKYINLDNEFVKFVQNYKKELYWKNDGHWNIRGNHLAGYLVSKYLLENNFIDSASNNLDKIKMINEMVKKEFYLQK